MLVRAYMTSPAVTVPATAPVREAAATMVRHRMNSVVVVDAAGAVAGLLGEREVELAEAVVSLSVPSVRAVRLVDLWAQDAGQLRAAIAEVARRPVGEVMRAPVETVGPDVDLWTAMSRMARLGIRRMPVVEDGRPVGLIARHDLMKAIAAARG
jgi:CBS domain-containing protein